MKLSPKQKLFCENYVLNGYNASDAYRESGYSCTTKNSTHVNASKLLSNHKVQSYIRTLEKERDGEFVVSKDDILKELSKMAFGNIDDIVDIKDGAFSLNSDVDPAKRRNFLAGVSSISSSKSYGKDGHSKSFNINAKDKVKALELMAKMTGVLDGDTDSGDEKPSISRVLNLLRKDKK